MAVQARGAQEDARNKRLHKTAGTAVLSGFTVVRQKLRQKWQETQLTKEKKSTVTVNP